MRFSMISLGVRAVGGLLLVGCTTGSGGPTSFGSPERTAHFLACLPVALNQAATTSKQIEAAKKVETSQVLDAVNKKIDDGDVAALAVACGPYLSDLVVEGNARAKSLQERLKK